MPNKELASWEVLFRQLRMAFPDLNPESVFADYEVWWEGYACQNSIRSIPCLDCNPHCCQESFWTLRDSRMPVSPDEIYEELPFNEQSHSSLQHGSILQFSMSPGCCLVLRSDAPLRGDFQKTCCSLRSE